MIRLRNLFARIRKLRERAPVAALPPEAPQVETEQIARPQMDTEQIARIVVERLSEDEMLRGDLTDRGFSPVLNFVASLVPGAAARAASNSTDEDVEEAVSHGARGLARAIVAAAETGEVESLIAQLCPPMLAPEAGEQARRSISTRLASDAGPDERAVALVASLSASLAGKA
jgi:hypothetical protein